MMARVLASMRKPRRASRRRAAPYRLANLAQTKAW
jgi:hypothetical protein